MRQKGRCSAAWLSFVAKPRLVVFDGDFSQPGNCGGISLCTRLHAIGFPCEIDHATAKTIAGISDNPTKRVTCAGGEYRIWRGGSGAEIWLHCPSVPAAATPAPPVKTPATFPLANTNPLDGVDPVRGMTIFHRGASDITVKLDRSMALSKQNPLDGVCLAYLDDRNGKGRPAPFVFEQLGFAADRFTQSIRARVQILGLAQKAWAYASEKEYLAATPGKRLIGRGALTMVEPDDVKDAGLRYKTKPATLWLVTGEIRRSIRMTNPLTGASYAWVLLATDRGEIDLVASPEVIEGDISVGHIMQTVATMTGRIIARL